MKKFLFRLSLFTLFFLCCEEGVCFLLEYLMHKAHGQTEREIFIADSLEAELIIMGSSRALHHYDPEILRDSLKLTAYNCGEDRMGIVFCYGRYQMLRKRGKPKVIIYDVEPDYDLLANDNATYLGPLRKFYNRKGVDSVFWLVDSSEKIKMTLNIYHYNSTLLNIIRDLRSTDTFKLGYVPYYGINIYGFEPERLKQDCFDKLKLSFIESFVNQVKLVDGATLIFLASPQLSYNSDSVYNDFSEMCKEKGIYFK